MKVDKVRKIRADDLVLIRGICQEKSKAQALILAGEIIINEKRIDKVAEQIPEDSVVRLRPRRGHQFVSRGGLKLEGALQDFKVSVQGLVCMDLGMSTGGFSDCLLKYNASFIYGVDVGKNLAHASLVGHPQIKIIEERHVEDLSERDIDQKCDLCVADISFHQLRTLIESIFPFLKPDASLVLLIKPQFELPQHCIGNGGIVENEEDQKLACALVVKQLESLNCKVLDLKPCHIKGSKGNQEYFVYAKT